MASRGRNESPQNLISQQLIETRQFYIREVSHSNLKKNGPENSIHLLKQRFTEGNEKYFFKENNFGELHISYFPFFYRT